MGDNMVFMALLTHQKSYKAVFLSQIAPSRTVKDIEANLSFAIFGKVAKYLLLSQLYSYYH